jgi:O-antigen/teichoic acid export membrane protein
MGLTDTQRSLPLNMTWGALGYIMLGVGRFLVFALLVKFLPESTVGQFALALVIVTPLSFLINMEMRPVYVSDLFGKIDIAHMLGARIVTSILLVSSLLTIVYVMQSERLTTSLGISVWSISQCQILLAIGVVRIIEAIGDVYHAVLQKHEQLNFVAISMSIKSSLLMAVTAIFLPYTENIFTMLISWVIITGIMVFFYDRRKASRFEQLSPKFNIKQSLNIGKLAFPVGLLVALRGYNEGVARFFLTEEMVAYFVAMTMIVTALGGIQDGINQAILPRLSHSFSYNIVSFWSLLLRVIISGATVMGCVIVLVWWQGEFILRLLYNASYSEYHSNFVLVMCAGLLIITSTILGEGLFACQRYKTRLAAVAIGFSCNGLICYFTIAQGGVKSAVVALICSGGITVVFSWVCLLVITLNQYAKQRE